MSICSEGEVAVCTDLELLDRRLSLWLSGRLLERDKQSVSKEERRARLACPRLTFLQLGSASIRWTSFSSSPSLFSRSLRLLTVLPRPTCWNAHARKKTSEIKLTGVAFVGGEAK